MTGAAAKTTKAGPPSPGAGLPATPPPPKPGLPAVLPPTPEGRGELLEALMLEWAKARYQVTKTYAKAYLAATGTDALRIQTAKQAAAEDQLELDYARAAVDGYKAMLTGLAMLGAPDAD